MSLYSIQCNVEISNLRIKNLLSVYLARKLEKRKVHDNAKTKRYRVLSVVMTIQIFFILFYFFFHIFLQTWRPLGDAISWFIAKNITKFTSGQAVISNMHTFIPRVCHVRIAVKNYAASIKPRESRLRARRYRSYFSRMKQKKKKTLKKYWTI